MSNPVIRKGVRIPGVALNRSPIILGAPKGVKARRVRELACPCRSDREQRLRGGGCSPVHPGRRHARPAVSHFRGWPRQARPGIRGVAKRNTPGGDLFSHPVTQAVSSALRRFTSVFGMGTGGAASLKPPGSIQGVSMHHFSQSRKGFARVPKNS